MSVEITKDKKKRLSLNLEFEDSDGKFLKISNFPLVDICADCSTEIEILDIMIEQIENKESYISNALSEEYMIEKYGDNFIEKISNFDFPDYDYFSVSLFLTEKLIIVYADKIYFIYKGMSYPLVINESSINFLKKIKDKFQSFN